MELTQGVPYSTITIIWRSAHSVTIVMTADFRKRSGEVLADRTGEERQGM